MTGFDRTAFSAHGHLGSAPVLDETTVRELQPAYSSLGNLPGLLRGARAVGHIAALPDEDGVYRSMPVSVNASGSPVPALGLAVAAVFLQVPPERMTLELGRALTLRQVRFLGSPPGVRLRDISIPIDDEGCMLVDYAGKWEDAPVTYFSFVDVWDAVQEGSIEELRACVEGKIVLLMPASVGDLRQTPLEKKAPGGFIHANMINSVLSGQSQRLISLPAQMVLTVSLSVLAASLLFTLSAWVGLTAAFGLALLYVDIAQGTFSRASIVLPLVVPFMGMGLTVAFAYLVGYVTEGCSRRWVQFAFGRYLGLTVADRISRDPTVLRLGGELREITIMFADLSGFTRMSTQVQPHVLTQIAIRYLGYIVEHVEANGGTVDMSSSSSKIAGKTIFHALPNPFEATRYHSLLVHRATVPDCLEVTAETTDGEVMGLRHRTCRTEGVQFHPESILTAAGKDLLRNFIKL